jgi:hypothetical protein
MKYRRLVHDLPKTTYELLLNVEGRETALGQFGQRSVSREIENKNPERKRVSKMKLMTS